jgi:DNA-binding FadR family transcriptional regulator
MNRIENGPWREQWTISPVRSREELLIQCRRAISEGRLRPGDRLLNERQVAQLSGLSRSTVRLVFAALEQEGAIFRQVGRGTYVTETSGASSIWSSEDSPAPAELMECRLVTEPSLVDLIVLKATDRQLEKVSLIAAAGRSVDVWQEAEDIDRRFHLALFEATGNRFFVDLGERLARARDSRSWLRLKEGSFSLEKWASYQREHEVVVTALIDRNAEGAKTALRHHLGGVRANAQALTFEL